MDANWRKLATGKLTSNFAKEFLCDAEIGGYHILRNTLLNCWVAITELKIPLHRWECKVVDDSFLSSYERLLNDYPKEPFESGNIQI